MKVITVAQRVHRRLSITLHPTPVTCIAPCSMMKEANREEDSWLQCVVSSSVVLPVCLMKLCLKKRKDQSLRQQGMVSWTVLEMSRSLIRSHVLPGPWACVGVGLYRQLGTNVDLWGWAYGSVVECLPDCSWLTQGSPSIPSTWNQCCWIWTLSPSFHMTDLWNYVCADFYLTLQWGIFHHGQYLLCEFSYTRESEPILTTTTL